MAEVKHVKMVSLKGTSNWHYWKGKMIDHLYAKDLYEPITGEKPAEMADKDWTKLDRKAMACLRQWVDEVVYHHVSELNSSKEIWDKLQDVYERKTAGNKTLLIRKLVNLRYKDGGDIGEHLNEMKSIITQLARMKMTLDEEWQAILLLNTLPESWETLVISLSNAAPDGKLTMDMVTSSLLNEEVRRKTLPTTSGSHALVSEETRGRSRSKSISRRDKSRSKSRMKKDLKCYYCDKLGHMKKNCWKFKKDMKEKDMKEKDNKAKMQQMLM